jgi:glyceraldehyde 3-phosphate dehydrogenase
MRIAINGFGRIGRLALRALLDRHPAIKVVGINDLADRSASAHLLRYDSNYGPLNHSVETTDDGIIVNGDQIQYLSIREWDKLPWGDLGIDVVIEATGVGTSRDRAAAHLTSGAERVLISAPATNVDLTVVLGVNTSEFDPSEHRIVSNASCTTNALAPPLDVVHREFGIKKGLMTTVHAYTSSQSLVDAPRVDLREARASALSIVPASTGAARAIGHVIPDLAGKMHGSAYRVPVPTVSIVEFVAVLAQSTTAEAINEALRTSEAGRLQGILGVSDEPLVSMDLRGDTRSSIIDSASTMVIGDNLTKVAAWYDNEWAYACRIGDVTDLIGSSVDPSVQT